MKSHLLTLSAVIAALLGLCVTTVQAQDSDYVVPRTEYG